jgi:4-hydroxy-4-methyl-2-oxoglutarate aldolase
MPVTVHAASLPAAPDLSAWGQIPVAIAVDCVPGARQINPDIRPLRPAGQQPRLMGRAVTVECHAPDFGAVLHALDLVGQGDVLVIAARGHRDHAMIGDILSGHLRAKAASGVIVDGAIRDTATLGRWDDFAAFSRHITPRGPTGASEGAVNGPVTFAGALINPGDLILGDDDGLVCLPPETWAEGLGPARAKLALEDRWTEALRTGTAVEAFSLPAPFRR